MEFTQEFIDSLSADEAEIMKQVADELDIRAQQVHAVISLVNEGCTVPFISRYRKEQHGSLDEVQVRSCDHLFKSRMNLENRRFEIIRGIFAQGKLTDFLYEAVKAAKTLTELEDLWAPFKKKKKTRGMLAAERGLEPLAEAMLSMDKESLEKKAEEFVNTSAEPEELRVPDVQAALAGAQDIIAERTAQDGANRQAVSDFYIKSGLIRVQGIGDEEAQKTSVYQMYWDYSEPLNQIKPHRILAVNRGEREGVLEVKVDVDTDEAAELLKKRVVIHNPYHAEAIEDGLARLLSPAVLREIRGNQSDEADDHGIGIFSENLKNLLMTQPIKGTRVLGVDPGIRTGTKCAALDETGKYLGSFVIYQHKADESCAALRKAIQDYKVQLVAVGNGTGTKEVQEIVSKVLSENFPDVLYTVVDEDGASVYSASDTAREEFPDLDLTIRGAISIGRRLQDPLAELVKIDPKSIGVGLYQHDLNQKKLSDMLDEVVGSVVNNVGVNLNTASASLLKYVSGISASVAKRIVAYREEKGKITSRSELQNVSGLGPKAYEQCAGFLKIPESSEPLDNTWVHPENYEPARIIFGLIQKNADVTGDVKKELKETYSLGEQTVQDIVEELKKPNRDPRDGYPKPIMQKGVVTFEDLKEGMKVTGKIKNVVDFGAFVDLGIKETALVHISELSDSYVSDPMDVVRVGDIKECTIIGLDADRRRISLSLKSNPSLHSAGGTAGAAAGGTSEKSRNLRDGEASGAYRNSRSERSGGVPAGFTGTKKAAVRVVRSGVSANRTRDERPRQNSGRDDGMTYNPFAALLKK
ncbi:RNA-binding transcriptional accessory protein [Treponema sp. OMZ 840]|uniref:helix-hairpin-helix domain-containing protein n=1 Tax=Treponema sp. OMZ 840 TaxID=244313 RepID=UPI003D928036